MQGLESAVVAKGREERTHGRILADSGRRSSNRDTVNYLSPWTGGAAQPRADRRCCSSDLGLSSDRLPSFLAAVIPAMAATDVRQATGKHHRKIGILNYGPFVFDSIVRLARGQSNAVGAKGKHIF